MSGAELLDVLREQERVKHEAELVGLAVIAQLEARQVAFELGAKNTVDLLRHALTIGARDAAGRVKLAAAVCERRSLTGVPVEPAHPQTAAAVGGRCDFDAGGGHDRGDGGQDRRSGGR